MRRLALALLLLLASPAPATEQVIAGLSQNRVAITTGFTGSEIFIYGAVRRDAPAPPNAPVDIIIAVTGPAETVTLRQKTRTSGIFVNGPGVRISSAPSFYAVATTRPLREAIRWTDDLRHRIGLDYAIRLIDAPVWVADPEAYRRALVRLRAAQGLYFEDWSGVRMIDDTLFQTQIRLPANLVEGIYRARVFLLRERQVIDVYETSITVGKVGLERWLYNLARDQGLLYGVISITLGLLAGWLASAAFRLGAR